MTGTDCIAALKALAEQNRMRILGLLLKDRLSVNEIVHRVNVSQYTVSKHLKILREAGLVEVEKNGKQRLYAVAANLKSHLKTNANVLELGCCSFRFDKLPK
jgi:DNA-binding transcriptional ArsR family regulator